MKKIQKFSGPSFIQRIGEEGWTHIKTLVDILHEPVMILDGELCVMAANEPFYRIFQVELKDTEGTVVYKLGNGQWNIPSLRRLLEDILPKNTFFKGFQVAHEFPFIGRKVMILNARQIYCKEDPALGPCPPIILLAMEDVTEMMVVADSIAGLTNQLEDKFTKRTKELELNIENLVKQIKELEKKN